MAEIVQLFHHADVVATLRAIADQIEDGEYTGDTCTMILDSRKVFHFGKNISEERSAEAAVFDLSFGIAFLMKRPVDAVMEE